VARTERRARRDHSASLLRSIPLQKKKTCMLRCNSDTSVTICPSTAKTKFANLLIIEQITSNNNFDRSKGLPELSVIMSTQTRIFCAEKKTFLPK
jgi:hypothetical protein